MAPEILCKEKTITLTDIELFNEYISKLPEYVADLPVQTLSTRNNYIDVEVH